MTFEEKIKVTKEVEKEDQLAKDSKLASDIIAGRQEVYIKELGKLAFEHPSPGLMFEGDLKSAQFKAEHLRKGDLLTDAQLRAVYSRPVTITEGDKNVVVGPGPWTAEDEELLERLPREAETASQAFEDYRENLQEVENQLLALVETDENKDEIAKLKATQERLLSGSQEAYKNLLSLKLKALEKQSKKLELFSISLEEQALLEKVKLYIPYCVKLIAEDGERVLWPTAEAFYKSGLPGLKVVSMFNLFLRGGDVRFFGDTPEEPIQS